MSRQAKFLGAVLGAAILIALAAGGMRFLRRAEPEVCAICQRPLHAQAEATVEIGGRRVTACCVRCALTEEAQTGKPVRLLRVTDYLSSKPLAPDTAYYVGGSGIVLCEPHQHRLDEAKREYSRVFDRCEPSLYAFARREDADAFARENGGRVLGWAEVRKEVETKP